MSVTGHMHNQKYLSKIASTLCLANSCEVVKKQSYPACAFDVESAGTGAKTISQSELLQVEFYQPTIIHQKILPKMTTNKKGSSKSKHNRLMGDFVLYRQSIQIKQKKKKSGVII